MQLRNYLVFAFTLLLSSIALADRAILQSGDLKALTAAAKAHGMEVVSVIESAKALVVENADNQKLSSLKKKISDLKHERDIVFSIKPVRFVQAARPGTIVQSPQEAPWGITKIKATQANSLSRGAGVKVCVVDSGIDKTRVDLQANIAGGTNYVAKKGLVDPNGYQDGNGHGTHVAGTIAAVDNSIGVIGVAPDSKIYAVKALNARGNGYLSDIAQGITKCVQVGAKVINLSLGADGDPNQSSILKTAVDNAIAAGAVVVAAAGNEGENISGKIPAGYAGVIAVAAVDSTSAFPWWSNFGLSTDDFTAPGVKIVSTWPGGGYNVISGTSMAAPHVAGVVALKISSGSVGLKADSLGRSLSTEGAGLINALETVLNQP